MTNPSNTSSRIRRGLGRAERAGLDRARSRPLRSCAGLALLMGLARAQEARSPLLESFPSYLAAREASPLGLVWVPLGPLLNSARVESVQGDPSAPGTLYVAFGSGNLWKTTDAGLSWRALFEDQAALGIGDIALAPSDPDVLWVGTGESLKKARNFTMPGTGVYRSLDGGDSWRHVGLADSWHISEIAVHPTDPDTALVAVLGRFWSDHACRGLYRTEDGGKTWTRTLFVNAETGANDVVFCRADPDVVYASTWEHHPDRAGEGSGVHRSVDGGRTWKRLAGGLPLGPDLGRIGVAVSWTDPNKAYALVDNGARDEAKAELFRTDDGGETWSRTHTEDLHIFSRIGWYFADCYVNPIDDDEVYALGVRAAHSVDGGASFELLGGEITHLVPSPAQALHLDHCELWIDPAHPERLVLGNDGGLYVSHDRGDAWLHHNNLQVGEFYDVAVDDQDPYWIYGGTQDDAAVRGHAREGPAAAWEYVWLDPWCGGDGCYTVPDPVDPTTVYFSSQHGGLRRKAVPTGRSQPIGPGLPRGHGGKLRHSFVAPYLVSTHDHQVLYHGGNHVLKSVDRGDNWLPISPDLSSSGDPLRHGSAAGALAESPRQAGVLYCGTDTGALWVSRDDGASWEERSAGLPPYYVRSIQPSQHADGRVYIALTGINRDDLGAYLFASEDDGRTWRSLSAGLPGEVVYAVLEDPQHEEVLYAATYRGVFASLDRGESWALLGRGLPGVAVADLALQPRERDLIAATHGRGIYRLDLDALDWLLEEERTQDALLPMAPARLPRTSDLLPVPRRSDEERASISLFLTEQRPLTIEVLDRRGEVLWRHALA
ncbi:MAG: hypothetical protein O2816_07065, partial [Planctomycetota bacterium]|nr:hypothetical protein [Planctomycetota bacterium]